MTINAPAAVLLAMYIAAAKRQGADPARLRGTIQNDILKEYIARGTYIFPPQPSMRLVTDIFAYCRENLPALEHHLDFRLSHPRGREHRGAGGGLHARQRHRLRGSGPRGRAGGGSFAPQLAFFFNAHNNFLEEVAKFRAARRLWARIMRDRFDAHDPRSQMLRFHTQTGGSTLTAQQPENNVVRVTVQALAAVLGGTQSLHTNSMDEALSLPTEKAVQVALRTQQILAHESGVADTVDPLAGFLRGRSAHRRNRTPGGGISSARSIRSAGRSAAIERGYIQAEIQEAAYRAQKAVEEQEQIVVGVNEYAGGEPPEPGNPADSIRRWSKRQMDRLKALRARRDASRARNPRHGSNRGPGKRKPDARHSDGVEEDLTLGEICGALRGVWGEYRPEG